LTPSSSASFSVVTIFSTCCIEAGQLD
jgi:hypothetical protein